MIQPDHPDCVYCSSRRQAQLAQLDRVHALMGEVPIITVEHEVEEPRGETALHALASKVWDGQEAILTG
jgi:anion-transporting  ArsA/GET3 family ATPase